MLEYRKESGLNYNHKQKNKKTSWLNSRMLPQFCIREGLKKKKNKLGLSWDKLSCQLGFGCTGINTFCLILINMKLLDT